MRDPAPQCLSAGNGLGVPARFLRSGSGRAATPRAGRAGFRWRPPSWGPCRRLSTGTSSRRPRRRTRCRPAPRLDGLVADADRGVERCAGGDAREDALLLEEFAGAGDGVGGADGEAGGEDGRVVELGDEALVEVAQAVHEVVVARLGGDDLDVRLVFPQVAADSHERAGGAEACHEVRDGREVGEDLRAGGGVVGARVVRVAVLVEHHPVGVFGRELLGDADGRVGAARRRGGDDLGAPHGEQVAPLLRGVLRHDADDAVALELGRHGERDAGVAAGRLQDGAAGRQAAVLLRLLDHVERGAVLDRAGRVPVLQLGPDADVLGRGQPRQADQGRVAHGRQRGVVPHQRMPPATAGRMVTLSPSASLVEMPSRKRTSSSLR